LDAVLQAVQLPAGVTGLDTGLTNVDRKALSHLETRGGSVAGGSVGFWVGAGGRVPEGGRGGTFGTRERSRYVGNNFFRALWIDGRGPRGAGDVAKGRNKGRGRGAN